MGEPGSPNSDDKQVANEETEEDATDQGTALAEEVASGHDSESEAQKQSSDLEPSDSPEKLSEDNLLTEVEIKQEIVSDEEGSEYTSDEGDGSDNDDAQKLVIDESATAKSTPKGSPKPSPSKVTEKMPDERKSKPVEIFTAAPKKIDDSKQSKSSANSDVKKSVSTKTSDVNTTAKSSKEIDKTPVKTSTSAKKSAAVSTSSDAEKSQTKSKNASSKSSNEAVSPDKVDKKTLTKSSSDVDTSTPKEKKQTVSKSSSKADTKKSSSETTPKTSKEKTVSTKSSSSTKPSPSVPKADPKASPADKVVVKSETNLWHIPFDEGWKREIVFRATTEVTPKKKPADVYYFAPCGSKLRSMPEVIAYLNDRKSGLSGSNFTFMKEAIYKPPQEVTRQAAQRSTINPRSFVSPKTTTPTPKMKKTPKAATPVASPPLPAVIETDRSPREDGPTSTIVDGQVVLGAKRWRKRKALPPDFLHTEQALSQRAPREPIRIQVPTKVTPTSKAADVTSPPLAQDTDGARPMKRKIILSTDLMSKMPLAKKSRLVGVASKGVESSGGALNAVSPNKVVFTFSRMGSGPITTNSSNGTFTLVRVNPLQTPCTLSCPGLQGQVPDLHCSICLLLFHSQCAGTTKDFICQRCKKQKGDLVKIAPKHDVNGTPALTNGDASHPSDASDLIKIQSPPTEDAPITINGEDPQEEEEALEDADLASDDDDDNFMSVAPEVVMASPSTPIKESSNAEPSNTEFAAVFNPPLPPLMRAPTSPIKASSPPGAPFYPQQLPRLITPPALVRPMVTLTPPYGAASNQLRTLVQQLPPRPIVSQAVAAATQSAGPVLSPVTSFVSPTITPPSVPVNLLSNSSPVVIGSQILTPVSISMPGIARGTVIYTNNPTLRFLLPSSGGMQSFVPSKPIAAAPPKDCAVATTTPTMSTPIVSASEASVTVASKILVHKPPLKVNMRGKSLCSLILEVGKAESGRSVKLVDTEQDLPDEPTPEVVEEPSVEKSEQDQPMEIDAQETAESVVGDDRVLPRTDSTSGADKVPVDSVVAPAELSSEDNTKTSEPAEPSPDNSKTTEPEESSTDISPGLESTQPTTESPLPKDDSATIPDSNQQQSMSKPDESVIPTNSTPVGESNLEGESEKKSLPAPEAPSTDTKEKELSESLPKESPILGPFAPIFTEEELIDWDRESVSSNDDEEEYRPTSPIIMCAQPFPDGYVRLRSTALGNRGAELSCVRGNCARVSCYRRPVTDLYADQEHAYSSPRSRQRWKQAGRKRMTTLLPPKRAFYRLQGSCEAFSNIFDYLSTADLLRASRVCKMWRKLASQPHQWATVKLKGLKVNDWKTCTKNLEFYGTTMLDMNGFEQSPTGWLQFLSHTHHLRKLQTLVFGAVPAWVLHSVAITLPQLLCLEAEYIDAASIPKTGGSSSRPKTGEELVPMLDVGWWASLPHLTVLRVRAPSGITIPSFTPQGNFKALSTLASLTHLSLTSLRSFPCKEVEFLERLPQLQVLELGQCKDWNDHAFQRLGKLRSLRRLRLELGGVQGDRGLANALGHMAKLEELTLLSFKITTSLAASIRRLKHLWHLTIWPDMSSEGAMIVYNTLQAVRSLKKLMSFSWGIIFTESTKTRYSRKSTKHREAQDVNEWWSKELRNVNRAKSIKIPLLKAFSDETPGSSKAGAAAAAAAAPNNSMEQGLIGVGHLKHKLTKCLPDVEIYVYQVPETLLAKVYGVSR